MERDDVRQRTINFIRTLTGLSEDEVKQQVGEEIEALVIKIGDPVADAPAEAAAAPKKKTSK